MTVPALRIRNLGKLFDTKAGHVQALQGINLDIPASSIVTLVGASGCGKSSLLRIIAGLERATTGEVTTVDGIITAPGPDRAVVFQSYSLYPWLTVEQNIAFSARLATHRSSASENRRTTERSRALMHLVGLDRFARSYPYQLSGGMQQRVAIARALLTRPAILLMDEPFGALDAQMRELMQQLLLRVHAEEKMTIVFVTHDVDEAVFLGDQIVVLAASPGRIDSVHDTSRLTIRPDDRAADPDTQRLKQVIRARIRETSTHTIDEGLLDTLGLSARTPGNTPQGASIATQTLPTRKGL